MLFNDPDPENGFLLLPDMKWDQKDRESLYLLAIARRRGILSMRELTAEHLPLLKNILRKGKVSTGMCVCMYILRKGKVSTGMCVCMYMTVWPPKVAHEGSGKVGGRG